MIEVLAAGAQTTVQDIGRLGLLRYGVGSAGVMDTVAMRSANLWLGNDENAAVVEIPTFPFEVRAQGPVHVAVAGADCDIWLDDTPMPPWSRVLMQPGQVLRIGPPRQLARCYFAMQGGIEVPLVLGSRSTQGRGSFGGFEGRGLAPGDVLKLAGNANPADAGLHDHPFLGFVPALAALPQPHPPAHDAWRLRVLPAGEYARFTPASIEAFWTTPWKVSVQSNRAGYRLSGETLALSHAVEMRSHGIVPGVIQVPPSGAPIIQLSDAHTAGGYPKIGTVIEADLWRVGQIPLGSSIRFVEAGYDEALAALDEIEEHLRGLRRALRAPLQSSFL